MSGLFMNYQIVPIPLKVYFYIKYVHYIQNKMLPLQNVLQNVSILISDEDEAVLINFETSTDISGY